MQYGAAESASAGNAKRVAYVIDSSGRIKKVFAKVDVSNFASDVLASL
jgi:peroxiredoxin